MSCRKADKQVRNMTAIAKKADETRLTPQQSSQIRGEIAKYVTDQLHLANAVVTGAVDWNPTQARVFGMLLNKVVPDLNASFHQHEHEVKQLTDLSRSELEAIAQGVASIDIEGQEDEAEQAGKMAYGNIIIEEEPAMTVTNRQKDALPADLTLHELGKAMSQVDLSAVPEHQREKAIFDHFTRIMGDTLVDKNKAAEVKLSRRLRQQLWG